MGGKDDRKNALVMWQKPMLRVLYALAPVLLASVYFFGWRVLLLLAVSTIAGFLCEYVFCRHSGKPVSSAVFVTTVLYTLTLPPSLPCWMAVTGIIFAVVFGKMVFGGFGRNVFNPALVGRAFVYINFTTWMTTRWNEPAQGMLGGFLKYSTDAVTAATPMAVMGSGESVPLLKLLLGATSGSAGETCAILIIGGGLYILWTKTANLSIVLSCLISMFLLQGILYVAGTDGAINPVYALFSGGFMLGAFFMATDPVSACRTYAGRIIYGCMIGFLTVVIRVFSVWSEGVMFAILLANMFAPITDTAINAWLERNKDGDNGS